MTPEVDCVPGRRETGCSRGRCSTIPERRARGRWQRCVRGEPGRPRPFLPLTGRVDAPSNRVARRETGRSGSRSSMRPAGARPGGESAACRCGDASPPPQTRERRVTGSPKETGLPPSHGGRPRRSDAKASLRERSRPRCSSPLPSPAVPLVDEGSDGAPIAVTDQAFASRNSVSGISTVVFISITPSGAGPGTECPVCPRRCAARGRPPAGPGRGSRILCRFPSRAGSSRYWL